MSKGSLPAEMGSTVFVHTAEFPLPLTSVIGVQRGEMEKLHNMRLRTGSFSLSFLCMRHAVSGWGTGLFFQKLYQP